MRSFRLHVLAADRSFFEGECESLVAPTLEGLYGIQANHQNMIAAIIPGTLFFRTSDGTEHEAAVSEGIVKVEDNDVLLLVDTAERPDEIDIHRAQRAAEDAKEAMLQKRSMREYREAQTKMARALSRLKTSKNRNV